jgi:ATP-dependent helicase/nuclease subunit B
MDRIDSDRAGNRLRIIDYKFKLGASPSTSDRDLYRAALRGEKLQPPVYSLLGKRWAEVSQPRLGAVPVEASFYYIAPFWTDGPLLPAVFRAEALGNKIGHEIKNTIAELVSGIKAGKFFIQRGPYCRYCEVAEICRKNHPPSLWRAENDPITAPHRQLRDKDPKKL